MGFRGVVGDMAGKIAGLLISLTIVAALGGCALVDTEPVPEVPKASALTSTASIGYALKPGDRVKVIVFAADSYSGDYKVDGAGMVTMPRLGKVRAAGLGVRQLEQEIAGRLKAAGLVESPQVSVLLDLAKPIYVIGAVGRPGEISFAPGMDVASAVAAAGGYTQRSDTASVYLTKAGGTGERLYRVSDMPPLSPGDVVRIPERS